MIKFSQCCKCVIGDEIDMNRVIQLGILGLTIFSWFYGGRFLLIGTALLALVGCSIYGIVQYYKSNQYPYKEMRNLVIETLKQIGCQPEIDKGNESHVNLCIKVRTSSSA